MKQRLFWFTWQPTPYTDYLFESLNTKSDFNLFVVYRKNFISSHPWKKTSIKNYNRRVYKCFLMIDWWSLRITVFKKNDFFLFAGWDHPTAWLCLTVVRLLNRSYAVWTDTPSDKRSKSQIKHLIRDYWLKWILAGTTRVLVTGQIGRERMLKYLQYPEKIVSFPFFVDLEKYGDWIHLSSKFNRLDDFKLFSSGRIVNSLKGHHIALQAIALAFSGSEVNWTYYIAGLGKDLDNLKQLASKLGISQHVIFLGWVEHQDVIEKLKSSHVFIHPSPTHDPYPNAILEAMAAGCIVFGSDQSGSANDRIESGKNGFIHEAGNITNLSNQLKQLLFFDSTDFIRIARKSWITANQWPISRGIDIINNTFITNK